MRLAPQPHGAATALVGLERFEKVSALLSLARSQLGGQLSAFEVMWAGYYRLTTSPPARSTPPLPHTFAYYVLVESLGRDQSGEQARLEALLEGAFQQELFSDAVVASSEQQRAALWFIREDSEQMEIQHRPVFNFDVSLPIKEMEAYVEGVRASLREGFGETRLWVFGHLGDGNLHLGVWGRGLGEDQRPAVERLVYQPLAALGGSISAEHGIGLEKKAYLSLSRTPEEIALMRRIKAALDPHSILNPGKVFD
jgi:FAD/FMN-containing dehydrogenase